MEAQVGHAKMAGHQAGIVLILDLLSNMCYYHNSSCEYQSVFKKTQLLCYALVHLYTVHERITSM